MEAGFLFPMVHCTALPGLGQCNGLEYLMQL